MSQPLIPKHGVEH